MRGLVKWIGIILLAVVLVAINGAVVSNNNKLDRVIEQNKVLLQKVQRLEKQTAKSGRRKR